MSLRDWLIVVGVLIVVGILADGFRRARKNRRDSIALDQSLSEHMSERGGESGERNPELPNGGARIVRQEPVFADNDSGWEQEPPLGEAFTQAPEQPAPQGAAIVDEPAAYSRAAADEPLIEEPIEQQPVIDEPVIEAPLAPEPAIQAEVKAEADPLDVPMLVPDLEERPQPQSGPKTRPSFGFKRPESKPQAPQPVAELEVAEPEIESLAERAPAEEVLVINLITDHSAPYSGAELLQALLACDMKFGEMNIFHRFEQAGGRGKIMFSMANGVEPGHFDLDQMDSLQTPAVSFFMGLPGPSQPKAAFEQMLQTVEYLQQQLGGQLEDEHHSVMRKQTLEHCRQRVSEFERRRLTQRRGQQ